MVNFFWAIGASIVVSIISLVGVFTLAFNKDFLNRVLVLLIGFAAGGLIGGAFLHLLPEALKQSNSIFVFLYVILGFVLFFILEKYIYWRHCHHGICAAHAFTYLNLIGDGIHNFTDGLAIGASFNVSIPFGVVTTLAIIFHEIPQEIGDFGVLVYGGFSRSKALFCNFISALVCVLGVMVGFPLAQSIGNFSAFLFPLVAGGFIYISACDLMPELHKQQDIKKTTFSILAFLSGVFFVLLAELALSR